MPLFIGAGGLRILQWQPGDIGDGHAPTIANTTPGFQGASPDLYYRETPFREGEYLYQAGTPWPMSPFMGDALPGFLYAIAGREWRIVQYGPLGLTISAVNALGQIAEADDTLSAAGASALKSTLSATQANDTVAAAGSLPLAGLASIAVAPDTSAATGSVALSAAAAMAAANDTLAGLAITPLQGALLVADEGDTVSSSVLPVLQARIRRGGAWPVPGDEPVWRRDLWDRDLRRVIDQAWRAANEEIGAIARAEPPSPDLSAVLGALVARADQESNSRLRASIAQSRCRTEDDAMAVLLLVA